ncbi:recombinase RecQ [Kushneria phosphatilytica]|uniref:ATP-dependent DNA helicase RecQ n=1 Tax=Kushneria phosphatilytica TaxID=657387 RepID=A0A1S1NRG1_9GAMM|nr:recombinase RecQ [Kushneria phosphatilytica]QEL12651.1 RecQ family ATP-dependent DNA helicase [Kushneria phosphatilytica]
MHHTLKRVFGFDDFRGGQQAVVERVIEGRSTAAIFATGAGKSLCYQLPALHLPHLTLVVSPLLALMQDQLAFLKRHGVAAATIDSSMERDDVREVMRRARSGELKILMVSVERLRNERFRRFLEQVAISLLVIDEAHCISEWGHNFRPDYLRLPDYQREFGIPQALLLTATATPAVIRDMQERFAIAPDDVITTGFYRHNLELLVEPVASDDRPNALYHWLAPRQQPGAEEPTIVYVTLQQTAENLARQLSQQGLRARAYHAGLDGETRDTLQQQFMSGEVPCIVATIAFGMGIDKRDIRNVVHFDLPKSIENYSQEIGRAGRDGEHSRCLVLANRDALGVLENFVYGDTPEPGGIRYVLESIRQAGHSEMRQWPVVLNTLSRESNIRVLPLKTLLVQLEMRGLIRPQLAYLAEYRLQYLIDSSDLVARFEGERARFVTLLVEEIPVARRWGTVDFERLYQAGQRERIDASRSRVISALEYFQQQGWLVLEGKRLTDVFEVLTPEFDIEAQAAALSDHFQAKERAEIERLNTVVTLLESEYCLTRRLAEYFGDDHFTRADTPDRCGHCSVCFGRIARLSAPASLPALTSADFSRFAQPFIERHREQLATGPGAIRITRFLCGLSMPIFTPLKARQLTGFARLEQYPYSDVYRWVEQQSMHHD